MRKVLRNISEDESIQADDVVNTEESVILGSGADASPSCVATAENLSETNNAANEETDDEIVKEELAGVYILQMTSILFPGQPDHAPKMFAIQGSPTPPN